MLNQMLGQFDNNQKKKNRKILNLKNILILKIIKFCKKIENFLKIKNKSIPGRKLKIK